MKRSTTCVGAAIAFWAAGKHENHSVFLHVKVEGVSLFWEFQRLRAVTVAGREWGGTGTGNCVIFRSRPRFPTAPVVGLCPQRLSSRRKVSCSHPDCFPSRPNVSSSSPDGSPSHCLPSCSHPIPKFAHSQSSLQEYDPIPHFTTYWCSYFRSILPLVYRFPII